MRIRIKGRNIITTYNHVLYQLRVKELLPSEMHRLTPFEITAENIENISSQKALRDMLFQQQKYVQGWAFKDQNGEIIGHLFLMKQGGNEVLYKIRNINSYLFAVRVFDSFRGRGYAGEMITWFVREQSRRGIGCISLIVKKNNVPAIKVYEKLGFHAVRYYHFVRIGRLNIPYHTL